MTRIKRPNHKMPEPAKSAGAHPCAWPGCAAEGTFPAPKSPRDLTARQYFCQPHIKEFNKNWNGLSGFNEDEIFSMQNGAATWNKPTWSMAVDGSRFNPMGAAASFDKADDLYAFFQQRLKEEGSQPGLGARVDGPTPMPTRYLPPDVQEACIIFNVEGPLAEKELKPRYLALVKQHHPDVSQSPHAADHIKRINVAYRILVDFAARRGLG